MERNNCLQGIFTSHFIYISFYLSLRVPGKGVYSMFPNRVPMGSDKLSPGPLVYFSFIHSCTSTGVPKRSPPTYIWRKILGHHPQSPMQTESLHTMGCSLVPQGDRYDTAISTPVPCSLQHNAFHLVLGRPEPH